MKIMLVDDDALLRDMYATKFQEAGDVIEAVGSAHEALSRLREEKFEAVVMDMVMPEMTGLELIKKINIDENNADVKCVVLSNQGEETDIFKAKKAGAIGYIIKAELIPSEVVAKVHEILA